MQGHAIGVFLQSTGSTTDARGDSLPWGGQIMNEDTFNMQTRKFLKKVGINAQREIERAVREALAEGRIQGFEKLSASVQLKISEVDLDVSIDDEIALE
jgi:hypothetical protein